MSLYRLLLHFKGFFFCAFQINICIYYKQLSAEYCVHITVQILHKPPEDGMFTLKHVRVMSVLLYVYDIVHLNGCNE